jgi:hypothetical protein
MPNHQVYSNHLSAINAEAMQKYTQHGFAREFPGLSLVHFVPSDDPIFSKITGFVQAFQKDLAREKLLDKLAFLPKETYHITIIGIALKPSNDFQRAIVTKVSDWFGEYRSKTKPVPKYLLHGNPKLTNRETVVLQLNPVDESSDSVITYIRNNLHNALVRLPGGSKISQLQVYRPHLTMAYIIKSFSDDESEKFMTILQKYQIAKPLGVIGYGALELRRFNSMEDWGQKPLCNFMLA